MEKSNKLKFKMAFNKSRLIRSTNTREKLPLCSPFSKSKEVSEIFMDKKTITKRLQKLMFEVKDLDSKMFLSKTISYIDQQQDIRNDITQGFGYKANKNFDSKTIQDLLSSEQPSRRGKSEKSIEKVNEDNLDMVFSKISNLSLCPELISVELNQGQNESKPEGKEMIQTATSDGFFAKKKTQAPIENPIIEESFSQASTIQCDCGLFQALLSMVSNLMREDIIKNKQQSQDDCLEIDDQFVEQITQEIIEKFYAKDAQHKKEVEMLRMELDRIREALKGKEQLLIKDAMIAKESLAIKDALKLKQLQLQQSMEKLSKMVDQLRTLDKELNQTSKKLAHSKMDNEKLQLSYTELQNQYVTVNKQKQEFESKLTLAQKQIDKHASEKQLYQQAKQHEIDSRVLQLELKNSEIRNLKTIIENFQKRTSLYGNQIDVEVLKTQLTESGNIAQPK